MKKFTLMFVAMMTVASASEARPAKIHCTVENAPSFLPREFTVTGLNTSTPESTIEDASLVDELDEKHIVKKGLVELYFSNQCDNGYEITLRAKDLADLESGKSTCISGTIEGGQIIEGKTIDQSSSKNVIHCELAR